MITRNKIEEKYKWDLSDIIKNQEEIEKIFKIMQSLPNSYKKYDKLLGNKQKLYEFLSMHEKDELAIERLAFYLSNAENVDIADTKIMELIQKFENLQIKIDESTAFYVPQMSELSDEYLSSLLTDKKFKNYHNSIKHIIRNKPHKLDENTNKLISKMGKFLGNSSSVHSILTNSEMQFKDAVDSKGKTYKVDNSTYYKLLRSHDQKLRETAFNSKMESFKQFNKTFASLYVNDIETDKFFTKLKHFDSVLDSALFGEEIPKSVFDQIIASTNQYLPLLQKYVKARAKKSKLKKFYYFDLFEDNLPTGKIEVDKAKEIILNALAPLGEEYLSKVKAKFNDKSIDFMPHKDKRTGAYCSNTYNCKTLILTNYNYDFESVSTLIHEMGHCINAEYFNNAQVHENAGITIFAAEIASTVNEILLSMYMLEHCKPKEKEYFLCDFLDGVRSTIFRQTLFSEFEQFAHNKIENDQTLTYLDLNKAYQDLNKKYYGNSCILPENFKYEWQIVPHFYTPFYVFSYATGMTAAITIASKLINEKDFYKKYIYFLKNGTNKPAIDVLKEIGVDLTTPACYDTAFEFVKKQLDLYINIK